MRAAVLVTSLVLLSTSAAGCKADRDKCAKATQHFAELVYWERENANIAKLPPEQRDAERKRKIVEFNREVDSQLEVWVGKCVGANNDDQSDCIIAAKTAGEALKCAPIAKGEEGGGCGVGGGAPAGAAALVALVALAFGRRRRRA
jgi:MYXO-CTERM domain-containing protein